MGSTDSNITETSRRKLRLWPGIVIVIMQWIIRFLVPVILPNATAYSVMAGVIFGLVLIIWWGFFSRAQVFERWTAVVLMLASLALTSQLLHISMATAMMGSMYFVYSIPVLCLAFVVWAVFTRYMPTRIRRISMAVTIIGAAGLWALLRTNGMDGEIHQYFAWRWSKTAEERLLSQASEISNAVPADSVNMSSKPEWPGFRGKARDGIINGVQIRTNWSESPPAEMWRRSIGPGCSSFAIHGNSLFTQEQRGEFEMVTCYNLNTGKLLWKHDDKTRFWDSHAGAGPRSTPTLSNGRVYTLGATGILNVLDERNGNVIWSRNAAADTEVKIPGWGYTSSPLVTDSIVYIAISGELLAYDILSGNKKWSGTDGGDSFSSPQIFSIGGISQILFLNKAGATSYKPSDGKILWNLPWTGGHIVQPALADNSDIVMSVGDLAGVKCVEVKNESGKWNTKERWTSDKLKPYFNDFVIHKNYAYGFDGPGLSCIDIEEGTRKWRGGRYGGQLLLLADQDLLLVLTEKGDLVLVEAKPDRFSELSRFPAIKGKTWNHPVLAGNVLVVRNSQEMAAFRLPTIN